MAVDKGLQKSLDRLGKTVATRQEARVIQLPLWPEPKRGTPNSFIRSALFAAIQAKDRTFIKGELLASQNGVEVRFTGEQLNQEDLTLWETLAHMVRSHPLGETSSFTAHGMLKSMNLPTGGKEHARLHEGITRLIACAVEIRVAGQGSYTGSLLEAARSDEGHRQYQVRFNRDMIKLFGENHWTAIDWEKRLLLRGKPLAQALHAFYSSHRDPYPLKLETLRDVTGGRNAELRDFKRKVKAALTELKTIGFLTDFEIVGDLVKVSRLKAIAASMKSKT